MGLLELGSTYVLGGCETVNLCDLDPTFSSMFNPPNSANVCVCVCVCVGDGAQLSLSGGSAGKESTCQCRRCKRHGFDPWVRKIPWRRKWQPVPVFLQILENSLDRGAWRATVHGSQSSLQLSVHTHMHLGNVPQDSTRM